MNYITMNEEIKSLPQDRLIKGISMKKYSDYAQLQVHVDDAKTQLGQDELNIKLALTFRTPNKVLRKEEIAFYTKLDVKCYRFDQDINNFENNYPNMLGCIADHLLNTYPLTQKEVVSHLLPEPLGVIKSNDTLYLVFEIFVADEIMDKLKINTFLTWFDLKMVQKYFKYSEYLDTILIPELLVVDK